MSNLNLEVSQDDLLQLSAMLDGEIEDDALDVLLARMSNEPALGRAWTRLSQVQAATHRHAQVGFDVDLSAAIAKKLATSQPEQVPTPVVSFRKPFESVYTKTASTVGFTTEINSKDELNNVDVASVVKSMDQVEAYKTNHHSMSSVLDIAPYNGADRRHVEQISEKIAKKKGFKQQLLAHLAVAASVASITVWIQNSFITDSELADVSPAASIQAKMPIAGIIPAALRDAGSLPMETVGNSASISGHGFSTTRARVEPAGGAAASEALEEPPQAENP